MDKITTIVLQSDTIFGLRPALEKFGFPKDEDIFVVFKHEGKKFRTGAIRPSDYQRISTLSCEDVNSAVIDWMNKASIQFALSEAIMEELGFPENGDSVVEVKFISKITELTLTWPRYYRPCHPGVPWGCWR